MRRLSTTVLYARGNNHYNNQVRHESSAMGSVKVPYPRNEPMQGYPKNSPERATLLAACQAYLAPNYKPMDIPCVINGKEIKQGQPIPVTMPSNHKVQLFQYYKANDQVLQDAIKGALEVREKWERLAVEHRLAIFLKAAELLSSRSEFRDRVNAATMMGQAKTMWQAEIDSACELIDFWRFNAHYATQIYERQIEHHSPGVWNRLEYRALEGFVAAISPFNFSSIGGNLCSAPAMMGNVALWKPSSQSILSNYVLFEVMREAGLPDGVIQFVPCDGSSFGRAALTHEQLAGVHFTGSTKTFNNIFQNVGQHLDSYRGIPRLVGETGGKNFHLIHPSAHVDNALFNTIRGAFEYQGQKCSATSRLYVPKSMWESGFKQRLIQETESLVVGQPYEPRTMVSAVIDRTSYNKITGFIDRAVKSTGTVQVLAGGKYSDKEGYFIHPTVLLTNDPFSETMREEIFGPVLTVYVYEDADFDNGKIFDLINNATRYGLTGSVFARDRMAIDHALKALRHAAGNVYINDKSTGAVVGQQPFGGGRLSGTNDKAGAEYNLTRWISVRSIKENFANLTHWSYPSTQE